MSYSAFYKDGTKHLVAFSEGFADIAFVFTAACGNVLSSKSSDVVDSISSLDGVCSTCVERVSRR